MTEPRARRRGVARTRFAGLSAAAVSAAAVVLASPLVARASGFHVDEQNARATGRAGAVAARPGDDPSAVYYNPAGVAELRGVQLTVGASLVRPSAEFTSAEDGVLTQADTQNFVLPQIFAGWRASELVAFGIGVYTPFGLALSWPASSPGRAEVRSSALTTVFITPIWALNLQRWVPGLSIGAGPDLVPASVRLTRDIPFGVDTAPVVMTGEAFGLGARLGLAYRPAPLPWLALGLSLRSPVQLTFRGEADFDAPPAYRSSLPPDGDVRTRVTLPAMATLGVAVEPLPAWEIELDGTWRGWSSYDQLDILLPDGEVSSSRRDWQNSYTVRLGTEYTFVERWSVRLGWIWDQTPVPANRLDFQLPDVDRVDVSAGFGARLSSRVRADLGALYVLPQKRLTAMDEPLEPRVKGRFRVDAWVVGVSVGIQLDDPDVAEPGAVGNVPSRAVGAAPSGRSEQ